MGARVTGTKVRAGKGIDRISSRRSNRFHVTHPSAVKFSDYEQPQFGTDVSSKRMDTLDLRAVRYGLGLDRRNRKFLNFVDLGAGLGIQSVRMALNGYQAYAYDLMAAPQTIATVARVYQVGRVTFITGDLSKLSISHFPRSIDIIYSQRFIHYLSYDQAVALLEMLGKRMKKGAHLFLSAAGFDTEIAQDHPDRQMPVERRFSAIDSSNAKKHFVTAPLCIYRLSELEKLASESGFSTIDSWTTEFGNVQGVFSKR
jgi:2-polyprenyl-3-methyl-5-hydroxy-6-metoxy-1,4-benzoquinol methylase